MIVLSMNFYLLLIRYKSPKDAETFCNNTLPQPQRNAVVSVTPTLDSVAVTPTLDSVAVTPTLDSVAVTPTLDNVAVTLTLDSVAVTPTLDSVSVAPSLNSVAVQTEFLESSVAVQTEALEPSSLIHLFSKLPVETHLQVLSGLFTSYLSVASSVSVPDDFLNHAAAAIVCLRKSGRTNVIYNLAKGIGTLRADKTDSRFPIKQMPMGLVEYIAQFFAEDNLQKVCFNIRNSKSAPVML